MFRFLGGNSMFFFFAFELPWKLRTATKVLLQHFRDVIFRKDLFGDGI